MRRGSYLQQVAQPPQARGTQLVPARRWPLRAGEERQAAPAEPFASRPAAPALPVTTSPPSSLPSAPVVLPHPAPETAVPPAREIAQPDPASAARGESGRTEQPHAANLETTLSRRPMSTLTPAAPPSRPVSDAPAQEAHSSASLPPQILPPASPVSPSPPSAAMRDPGTVRARLDPIPATATARPTSAPALRPPPTRVEPHSPAGLDGMPISATHDPPAAAGSPPVAPPRPVAPRPGEPAAGAREPQGPAVKIGSIEVRVVTPVPPPAPQAPAAAAPTALSRGFASPFGLRQG
jgi:hypothetical protein